MRTDLSNSNPDFDLSPHALDFIKEHGGVLTMDEAPATGCCTNVVFVGARLGRPDDASYYRKINQDGIEIFYDPYLIKNKKYEIGLEGFLRWKTLVVY